MENTVIPFPLHLCFLADNFLLVVSRILGGETISEGQKRVLEKTEAFFEIAMRGKKYSDTLKLGEDCVEASRSYSAVLKAVKTIDKKAQPSEVLKHYIKFLKSIRREPKRVSGDLRSEAQKIKNFFEVLRALSWEKVEKPVEEVVFQGV